MATINLPDENQSIITNQTNSQGLNREPFTLALIKTGLHARRISQEETISFQQQIMEILKELILRYTKEESTSVMVDTAENILQSIFYSIDAGLQSMNHMDAAIHLIKSGNARLIYDRGLAIVNTCFKESKDLYLDLKKSRLKVGLEAYDLTIDEGLEIFFHKYGPIFDAHKAISSIDYPLLFDDMSIKGVFYIRRYIETLLMENNFCRLFPEKDIKRLLVIYGQLHKIHYAKTLTNIFELVLYAAFFAVLSEENPLTLTMTNFKYEVLVRELEGNNPQGLEQLIDDGMTKVLQYLQITDEKLTDYILQYKDTLKTRLSFALETDNLKKILLLGDDPSFTGQKAIYIDGERMSNSSFLKLVNRLTRQPEFSKKLDLIHSEVHSIEDLIDILDGNCFFGGEFKLLFSQFNDDELALLARIVFSDELREGTVILEKAVLDRQFNTDAGWQQELVKFLAGLDHERLKDVENWLNRTV